jgi:hypothetical protein
MIRESSNQEKPILWILLKELTGISEKNERTLCSEIWEIKLLQRLSK